MFLPLSRHIQSHTDNQHEEAVKALADWLTVVDKDRVFLVSLLYEIQLASCACAATRRSERLSPVERNC